LLPKITPYLSLQYLLPKITPYISLQYLLPKLNSLPIPSTKLAEGIKFFTAMRMEKEVSRASETASGVQYITCAERLGTGQSAENKRQVPVETGEASGAIPRRANTRPRRGSTQQQETQPVETVSQATLGTTKTGKPRQRIQWRKEMNTFIMRQYCIITKLGTIKIGYRQELHDRFTRECPEMDVSEQRTADQLRAIVAKNLLTKPWLEEIRAQVAETLKETTVKENDQDSEENINTDEETTQPISEKEKKKSKA
jgi:hypothetical protein